MVVTIVRYDSYGVVGGQVMRAATRKPKLGYRSVEIRDVASKSRAGQHVGSG
jgi:hypothetical protein